ncbi:hypothetical protein Q1695_010539 [Nippostrongylus brasiliensis]|nr:hypothetical protein Q1695_010539 [Nippostrongylus brasiliensis]
MEIPHVHIDPEQKNSLIADLGPFIAEARRIVGDDAIASELKEAIYQRALRCIDHVKRFYKTKEKEEWLLKRESEVNRELLVAEPELARKERSLIEMKALIEELKLQNQLTEMKMIRSKERTVELMKKRKALEEENKRVAARVEKNRAFMAANLEAIKKHHSTFVEFMERSPQIARQNQEKNAIAELKSRLDQLEAENVVLEQEETKLKRELELQTETPMRVFLTGFAKVMTRTYEMQDRLKEARKVYKELKDEENERRLKAGANDYDMFDATFMSQDLSFAKVAEQAALAELPTTKPAVHLNSVEDESGSGCTSSASEHSPASPQPPQNTEEDVLMARTDAVNQYVAQQAESVSRISETGADDSDEDSSAANERQLGPSRQHSQRMEVEVGSSNAGEDNMETDNNDMNETVDVDADAMQNKEVRAGDFSDDESVMDATHDDVEANVSMDEDDLMEEEATTPAQALVVENSPKAVQHAPKPSPKATLGVKKNTTLQGNRLSSQNGPISAPLRTAPVSQASDEYFNRLVSGSQSPVSDDENFNFNMNDGNNEFDPTEVLNISTHSNDPGGDFLTLMQSKNEKKEKQRKGNSTTSPDFSFSMFTMEAGNSGNETAAGGDFVFDFGSTSQMGSGGAGDFQFNFGEEPEQNGGTAGGFNLFGF